MTDKELLELAAKAAGLIVRDDVGQSDDGLAIGNGDGDLVSWNPLTDDGDALRLAVKLNLAVTPYPIYNNPKHSVMAQLKNLDDSRFEVMEMHGTYPYAATRRAITRAAAEIGKAMP
jgi:hypothetical protein